MEDDQKFSKFKTTIKFKMEYNQKIQNGRRPKYSKWKTTKKIPNVTRPNKFKMEDDQKNSKWKTTKKNPNGRRPKNIPNG